jgi:hypothetical protein
MIVAPVVQQIPHGLLPPSVLTHGSTIRFGQFNIGPSRHDLGISDEPLKHLAHLGDVPVCLVDLRERVLLLPLETVALQLHAGLVAPRIVQFPCRFI